MIQVPRFLRSLAFVAIPLVVAGCAPSSSQPAEKIGGMAPAEYREKAEQSREVPAKAKGRVR